MIRVGERREDNPSRREPASLRLPHFKTRPQCGHSSTTDSAITNSDIANSDIADSDLARGQAPLYPGVGEALRGREAARRDGVEEARDELLRLRQARLDAGPPRGAAQGILYRFWILYWTPIR